MKICFWNTHSNYNINKYIENIVADNCIDVIVLAEYKDKIETLLESLLNLGYDFKECITIGCERIRILEREHNFEPAFQNKYCSIQIIDNQYILASVHLPSKLYADDQKRGIVIDRVLEEIYRNEGKICTDKVIILGDFNENPYESGCLGANHLHGLPSFDDANKNNREIMGEKFKMFYNPMWNFFGDFNFPTGTYYCWNNEVDNPFWNIYDQVIISPSLRECFIDGELKILYKAHGFDLIDENNHPNKNISDHLPIVFEIKEN